MTERADVVAITAAMPSGTGTGTVAAAHPARFFDVGIAEGHGVTFAAGMATRGMRPVVAIYSTFLQRAYDNVIHDVALQSLPVTFAMDRAGFVGEDGETHMGLYDIAYMLAVPNMTLTVPKDSTEMLGLLRTAAVARRAVCLPLSARRGPRTGAPIAEVAPVPVGTWEVLRQRARRRRSSRWDRWCSRRCERRRPWRRRGSDVTVVNCRYLKPYDEITLHALSAHHQACC
jgi:1-deoxy-D-xylulose-5-phosphate synthase